MLILKRNSLLYYNGKNYKCSIGKNGIRREKKEGDFCTPAGKYDLGPIYFRKDKIKKLKANLKAFEIKKNMYWEDNPLSKNYNTLCQGKKKTNENLFRKDSLYDIILVINYNKRPVIPYKGSAIFIHVSKNLNMPTKGCIALKKKDLIALIKVLKSKEKILIIL